MSVLMVVRVENILEDGLRSNTTCYLLRTWPKRIYHRKLGLALAVARTGRVVSPALSHSEAIRRYDVPWRVALGFYDSINFDVR
jgi:hypothetical protein